MSARVANIVMLFREEFWKKGKLAKLSFIQSSDPDVPVFWTLAPRRAPMIVAWAGGRRGAALALVSASERRDRAITAAARVFGLPRAKLGELLVDSWTHNWEDDPFARGAYSYPLVGGAKAGADLGQARQIGGQRAGFGDVFIGRPGDPLRMPQVREDAHAAALEGIAGSAR